MTEKAKNEISRRFYYISGSAQWPDITFLNTKAFLRFLKATKESNDNLKNYEVFEMPQWMDGDGPVISL